MRGIKIIAVLVLLIALVWGLAALAHAPQLNVRDVIVSGNSAVPTSAVIAAAQNALQGNFLWIFPNSNTFWYPKKEILNTLQYSYSWIDSISINRTSLTAVAINIKERVPVAVWCGASQAQQVPCKLMDVHGYIFAPAPDFSGAAYIRLYGPLTSADWRGAKYFSESGVTHILSLAKGLTGLGFQTVTVEASNIVTEDSYTIFLQSGTQILVQVSDPVNSILSNISSLLTQKIFAQSATHNFSDLVSLDMRFGNKIFYKFKGGAPASSSTATSTKI